MNARYQQEPAPAPLETRLIEAIQIMMANKTLRSPADLRSERVARVAHIADNIQEQKARERAAFEDKADEILRALHAANVVSPLARRKYAR